MKHAKFFFYAFVGLLTFSLASCTPEGEYREHQDIAQMKWTKEKVLSFNVPITDTTALYDMSLSLRHGASLENGNIIVEVKRIAPGGEEVVKKYDLIIRDRKTGELMGSAMGDIVDTEQVVETGLRFTETGTYKFSIAHTMEQGTVSVLDVGLVLKKQEAGK